ncbi:unnamed protein product [Paramecium primaurelia]|uniref:RING-type domain-containing protein n=1 Tax=Paramecium primaurelia TaxID=5886 RepID=A0A8S1LD02_PARPR|nr:unnamed protein product [Paramecium primaurelia]
MGSTNSVSPVEVQNKKYEIKCCVCQEQNQNLVKLKCDHYYHIHCLIQKRMNSYNCICKESIRQLNKIDDSIHKLFLQQQVQMLFQKNSNQKNQLYQFVSCPSRQCTFYFIYDSKLNVNKSINFFCIQCNGFRQYDEQLISRNDRKLQVLNQIPQTNQIQIFKQQQSDQLQKNNYQKLNHHQEQNINKEQLEEKYQQQLLRIIESTKLQIKFCHNNCGFMYVENNTYDINDNLCQNCNFCYKCDGKLFQDFIQIKKCNHYYHILCTYKLVDPNNIQSLKCYCDQQIDDEETKIQLNIICMICGKYDPNLKQLDCQHYVHLNCISNNSIKFSSFTCYICEIPILNFLQNHQYIHENLKLKNLERILQQIEKECYICFTQSSENLITSKCNHKVHITCLRKRYQEIKGQRDQYLKCLCGQSNLQLITDQQLIYY